MKKFIFVVFVFILGAAVGAGLYWQFTRSPRYALMQAHKAIKQHDLPSFEKYVDIEGVAGSAIDQLFQTSGDEKKPTSSYEQLKTSLSKGVLNLLKPQLAKIVKQQVATYIEKGKFEDEQTGTEAEGLKLPLLDAWNHLTSQKLTYRGIAYVKKDEKITYVGLKLFHEVYKSTLVLDLKLRDRGDYWQVAELSNLSDFMKKLNDLEAQQTTAPNNQTPQPK